MVYINYLMTLCNHDNGFLLMIMMMESPVEPTDEEEEAYVVCSSRCVLRCENKSILDAQLLPQVLHKNEDSADELCLRRALLAWIASAL